MTFTEVVAKAIADEGVEHVFGLMGAGTIRLTHHLTVDHDIAYHGGRHEHGVVGAADGYARVSGLPGVAMVTWGPGVTNTVTALITALRGRSPVVFVAGDNAGIPIERSLFSAGTQRIDVRALMDHLGIDCVRPHPRTAARDVANAFAVARRASAPVALLLPMEYETAPANGTARVSADDCDPPPSVDEEALAAAAAALEASERPVVLAGRGAIAARGALVDLADRAGALLVTTLRAKDLFAGHSAELGVAGGYSTALAAKLLAQADCVLAFGASLTPFSTRSGGLFPQATVVRCDVEPEALADRRSATIGVLGDAGEVAALLAARVPGPRPGFRSEAAAAGLGPDTWRETFDDCSTEGALDPRAICVRLDGLLPSERTIVVDPGAAGEYPAAFFRVPEPAALVWPGGDFGAVGTGLGPAIGAATARPDRTTVLCTGDGGLFMSLQELDTAVRERTPMLVVCLNDRAFGSEYHHMRDDGIPESVGARFETPDLAAVARSLGCEGEQIVNLEQLDSVPERLSGLDRPLLLDCLITQEVLPSMLRQHLVG